MYGRFQTSLYGVTGTTIAVILPSIIWLDTENQGPIPERTTNKSKENDEPSFSSLLRSYFVYTLCSITPLVDAGPQIISTLFAIPILKQVSELVIRESFFKQFVGGETLEETSPLIRNLRRRSIGCLLAYSVEYDESVEPIMNSEVQTVTRVNRHNIDEMAHSIRVAGDLESRSDGYPGGKTWVALKLSALLRDPQCMERFSIYLNSSRSPKTLSVPYPHTNEPGDLAIFTNPKFAPPPDSIMNLDDVSAIRSLYDELRRLCIIAKEKGVALVFDAEHTWYTPAIDTFTLALSREFNHAQEPKPGAFAPQPLIYATYQSYLRRGTRHLAAHLEDAKQKGYVLGVKLVRGAYQSLEHDVYQLGKRGEKRIIQERGKGNGARGATLAHAQGVGGNEAPVWTKKEDTDKTYNECIELLLSSLASDRLRNGTPLVGVIFATHNRQSCDLVLNSLLAYKLATRDMDESTRPILRVPKMISDRITFGQLLGMRDDLTNYIAANVIASSPMVLKYVPYGPLENVIPYLSRRIVENKSVLGASGEAGASGESRRAIVALKQKLIEVLRL
ncbi:FAD-linked oxidoreductase-like protein [Cantharellus anzutake]|uniref:FAD-linked oxidoreductase-like protein n=1 Tax=Cantharellus anzutake TaxID=1750568 RepID=UPI001903E5A9|nr:FAD-linked oxidoreductase-like protein [Cantharellus anzutake]KAF8319865.1 FAD-linked oxidoreductase-like protein [Cantharellus anzutake]